MSDAQKHKVDIDTYSTNRLVGGQIVDKLSHKIKKNAVALCIRTNYKTTAKNNDKIFRIEVLKKKFEDMLITKAGFLKIQAFAFSLAKK